MRALKTARTGIVPAVLSGIGVLFAGTPAAHATGMPQLDFANPLTLGQVMWGGVIFLIFFLALRSWALPKVGTVLKNRSDRIAGDLELARNAKSEADVAVAELLKARREAQAEAQAHVEQVLDAERAAVAERLANMNAKLEADIAAAEAAVAEGRRRALEALRPAAADTASLIVSRMTGVKPDEAAVLAALPASSV
ncbi:MAG: hypothetical protein LKH33_02200 [Acetobacter sp.]|nr:hypothetical protein [Acetobacter sp.]MCH4060288.1 hypothetical protein [Acetobacter sp.]MCH4087228.1 hypothetical protein [Acetobacter sp.]MCI1293049.1 hypothetical protein [Acetobacter sp.]MCI1319635.1 hypothetical protein [Acetobacter sp.]